MSNEPAAAIVDVQVQFGIIEKRPNNRVLGNQLQVAWIDFDHLQRFDIRVTCENLAPRAGGESDHEDAFGRRMHRAYKKRTNGRVGIVLRINAEVTVVDGTSKEGALGSDTDDAIAVFH